MKILGIFSSSPITTKFSVLRYKCLKRHLTDCFKEEEARGEKGVISQVHKWVKWQGLGKNLEDRASFYLLSITSPSFFFLLSFLWIGASSCHATHPTHCHAGKSHHSIPFSRSNSSKTQNTQNSQILTSKGRFVSVSPHVARLVASSKSPLFRPDVHLGPAAKGHEDPGVFSCPEQLNRWPCHWRSDLFILEHKTIHCSEQYVQPLVGTGNLRHFCQIWQFPTNFKNWP